MKGRKYIKCISLGSGANELSWFAFQTFPHRPSFLQYGISGKKKTLKEVKIAFITVNYNSHALF